MRHRHQAFYFISARRPHMSDAAADDAHEDLRRTLQAYGATHVKDATGCYKGATERSFAVWGLSLSALRDIAFIFRQESILEVSGDRTAHLHYTDGARTGDEEYLGRFQNTVADIATAQDAYTLLGGNYYICAQ